MMPYRGRKSPCKIKGHGIQDTCVVTNFWWNKDKSPHWNGRLEWERIQMASACSIQSDENSWAKSEVVKRKSKIWEERVDMKYSLGECESEFTAYQGSQLLSQLKLVWFHRTQIEMDPVCQSVISPTDAQPLPPHFHHGEIVGGEREEKPERIFFSFLFPKESLQTRDVLVF